MRGNSRIQPAMAAAFGLSIASRLAYSLEQELSFPVASLILSRNLFPFVLAFVLSLVVESKLVRDRDNNTCIANTRKDSFSHLNNVKYVFNDKLMQISICINYFLVKSNEI